MFDGPIMCPFAAQKPEKQENIVTQSPVHMAATEETYIGGTLPDGYKIFCSSTNFFTTAIGFLTPEIYEEKFLVELISNATRYTNCWIFQSD
jgi:hypothetical protein